MAPIPEGGTIAVTGAAGFIASHCVTEVRPRQPPASAPCSGGSVLCALGSVLCAACAAPSSDWRSGQALSRGYRVRATVRDETDPERCEWMWNLPAYKSGRLTIHAADLDNPGCFDDIFKGCHGVLHVSHVSDYSDEDYVAATCEHIIKSIEDSGTVSRLIFTSSVAGVISEISLTELRRRPVLYEDRYPDEEDERRTHRSQGYSISKNASEDIFAAAACAPRHAHAHPVR